MKRDHVLFLAIAVAVVCPAMPGLGNPENIVAILLVIMALRSNSSASAIGFGTAILILATLASMSTVAGLLMISGSYSFNPNALGPYLRIAICFQALRYADDPAKLQRWLLWLGAGTSAFAILQFLSPGVVAAFTSAHYLSSERSSAFVQDFSGNSIVRVIGFFENPSSIGLLSIALILLSVRAYSVEQLSRKTLLLFVILHVAAGILSLSKIFVAGLPLLMIQLLLLRYRLAFFIIILLSFIGISFVLGSDAPLAHVVRYAFDAALDPDIALKNRYVDQALVVLDRSWLFGYGVVVVDNVIVNDSAYLEIGYRFGVLGGVVLATLLSWSLLRWKNTLPASLYLVLVIILIAGVGANSLLGFRVDIFLTAMCALLYAEGRAPHKNEGQMTC
jgi:hypothetical protein